MLNETDKIFVYLEKAIQLIIEDRNKLLKENKKLKEKADKWDYMDKMGYVISDGDKCQTITHRKMWEKNQQLEAQVKELKEKLIRAESSRDKLVGVSNELQKYKQFAESVKEVVDSRELCDEYGCCDEQTELKQLIEGLK